MKRDELLDLHDSTCQKCRGIMSTKNHDYSGGDNSPDALMNFKSSAVLGVDPLQGLLVRVMDKLQRIRTYSESGKLMVQDEGVDDAFDDIVNYMILGKALVRDTKAKKPE